MIDGVVVRTLVTHGDDRGFFREIVRVTDEAFIGFGQWSHSLVRGGILKAWHGHVVQYQWTYMASGRFKVALHDHRPGSPTFGTTHELTISPEDVPVVYGFPPGVLHGYRCLEGPAHVLYLTSGVYDLADEVRVEPDAIAYDWGR